ncbi:glycosyltransferase family 4 protein [soil metagenome]
MRILIVADWHAVRGGSERYVHWLRESLVAEGHHARLFTGGASASETGAEYAAFAPEALAARAFTQLFNPFALASLHAALRDFRPDAVLLCGFLDHLSPAILALLRGIPTVLSVHDYKLICPVAQKLLPDEAICAYRAGSVCWTQGCVGLLHWLRDQPRYGAVRVGTGSIDRVVACSEWLRRVLAEQGIASEALLIPVPPPSPSFRRQPAAEPRFLFLGRLSREKGVHTLLGAFHRVRREHPTATLRLAGEGAERGALVRLSSDLGLGEAVVFTGWLEPSAVEAELARAWALVAPSVWAEPMGLVTVEANVRRVPVIASETGGFAETIEPGAGGLLVPNGDVDALASAMLKVATGRAFGDLILPEAVARRTAARHDLGQHTRKLVEILQEAREPAPRLGVPR